MRRSEVFRRFARAGAAGLLVTGFAAQAAQAALPTGGMMLPRPRGPARADIPTPTSISATRVPSATAYGIVGGTTASARSLSNAAPAPVAAKGKKPAATPEAAPRTAAVDPANPFAVPGPGAADASAPVSIAEDATAPDEWAAEGMPPGRLPAEPVDAELAPAAAEDFAGLQGVCPVTLREERRSVTPRPELFSEYAGRRYEFATPEAKFAFDADPERYAPVLGGRDVVMTANGVEEAVGTLRHAGFYRERLYLFQTEESYKAFYENPRRFVVE